jgi:hypothetical protein
LATVWPFPWANQSLKAQWLRVFVAERRFDAPDEQAVGLLIFLLVPETAARST